MARLIAGQGALVAGQPIPAGTGPGQARRGWYKEVRAEKLPEGPEKEAKINDAKTFYALASLSKVWVLLLIFAGTLFKLGVGLYRAPWFS